MKAKELINLLITKNKYISEIKTKTKLIKFIENELIQISDKNKYFLPLCLSRENWVIKNNNILKLLTSLINQYVTIELQLSKKIYLLINNVDEYPKCKVCNKDLSLDRINYNISPFCSSKCMKTKKGYTIRQLLKVNVVNEKYGVDNVMKIKSVKDKHKIAINNVNHEAALQKRISTNLHKYGVDNPMKSDIVKLKGINTNLQRYGETNYTKTDSYKKECRSKTISSLKYKSNNVEWLYDQYITNKLTVNQIGLLDGIDGTCISWRLKHFNIDIRSDSSRSKYEDQIIKYIKEIYSKDIIINSRKLIKPKEIDVFIPEHRFGIELNGIYFHSYPFLEQSRAINTHLIKYNLARDNDISIFNITDIEWVHKNELVKSMIRQRLQLTQTKYFARKLQLKQISDNSTVKEFLNENHIQGSTTQISVCYGLYNSDDELISLQTYIKRKDIWELTRFAVKRDCHVIGGFSKILSFFRKTKLKNDTLISFLSLDFGSNDKSNVYESNGFTKMYQLRPDYRYSCVKLFGHELVHKSRFRKSNLLKVFNKDGLMDQWNNKLTEFELVDVLNNNKFNISRIYDVGKIKYSINNII